MVFFLLFGMALMLFILIPFIIFTIIRKLKLIEIFHCL